MKPQKSKKSLNVLIHLIGWGIVLGIPFLFSPSGNRSLGMTGYLRFSVVPLVFLLVFYLDYLWLIDRLLFRKKTWQFVAVNVLLIAVAAVALHLWQDYLFAQEMLAGNLPPRQPRPEPPVFLFLLRDATLLACTAALAVAIKTTGQWFRMETEKQETEAARTKAELRNLKSQLNPHFLFNTLNNIYSLIAFDPEKARYAVDGLSRLMRYVLYDNNQSFVPLSKEIAFMQSYIELMSLRLPAGTKLEVRLPERDENIRVAPLLFITLVENAFKHGVSHSAESFIRIDIRILENRTVSCTVENTDHPKQDRHRTGSGIGLNNLEKRLALIYPDRFRFRAERKGNIFFACLILNTQEPEE